MFVIKEYLNLPMLDLIRQIVFHNISASAFPYKVTFGLTYRCNLRCVHCNIWTRQKKDELSLSQIKSVLGSMDSLRWLQLTGGEIFLREDIEEILNFIIEKMNLAALSFPTNGILSNKIIDTVGPLSKKLKGTRIIITCSVDGTRETHNRLKGSEGAYDRCMETFTRLRTIDRIDAHLGVTLSKDNYRTIPSLFTDISRDIDGFMFEEFHFNFADRSFFYNNKTMEPSGELVDEDVYFFIDRLRHKYNNRGVKAFLENRFFRLMPDYLRDRRSPIICSGLKSSCFIDPYGDVYPCINYEAKLGSLESTDYDFLNFWKLTTEKRSSIRKFIEDRDCRGCWTPCEAYPSILARIGRH